MYTYFRIYVFQLFRNICLRFFFHCCMSLPSIALSLRNLQLLHLKLWSKMGWVCLFVLRLETSKNKLKTRCIEK